MTSPHSATRPLADRLLDALPQTQCTRCGYADCAAYAQAMAAGQAAINQCPPGGVEGIRRLAALTGQPVRALNPEHGLEGPRGVAWIDEDWCIGCTLCITACPVDCIVGSPKRMHTVIEADCTGCELCVAACPVDCIHMESVTGERTGWDAWSPREAQSARERYDATRARRQHAGHTPTPEPDHPANDVSGAPTASTEPDRKRALIEAALTRARQQRPPV